MELSIIAFALALAAPLVGVPALIIYVSNLRDALHSELAKRDMQQAASFSAMRDTSTTLFAQVNAKLDALRDRMSACESDVKLTSNAHLSTELAALAADVDSLAKGVRKNFGRVFAELHADDTLKRNAAKQADIETPEETRARLRAEHGLPTMGKGKLNGE